MDKNKISNSLLEFYKMLEKHEIKLSRSSKKTYQLKPKNFIVIGAGSLVLQDILPDTSDIDLLADVKETYYCTIKAVDNEKIQRVIGSSDGFFRDILGFDYKDCRFEVFRHDASYSLSGDVDAKTILTLDDLDIYVRPAELVIRDFENALLRLRELGFNEDDSGVMKYRERVDFLNKS